MEGVKYHNSLIICKNYSPFGALLQTGGVLIVAF